MKLNKWLCIFAFGIALITSCDDDDPTTIGDPNSENSANQRPLGTSADELLAGDEFTSARVEIAYIEGFRPTQETIDLITPFLEQRLNKPDGISITQSIITTDQVAPYDINEIVAIEDANRTVYNNGDEIGLWIFFADGNSATDTDNSVVLGTAYRNTSMVLFEKTFMDLEDNNVLRGDRTIIETATLRHEFGHLFGLVNTGTPLTSQHEDTDNPRHCEVENCLMYFQTVNSVFSVENMSNIPEFDELCLNDLRANGGL